MSEESLLDTYISKDPTWHFAYHFVRKNFDVPSHMFRLFRSGWHGEIEPIEYVKVLGFSHLNPSCLIQAAEISGSEDAGGRGSVDRAIRFLGIRFSAVVIAIHLYTHMVLRKKPKGDWEKFFKNLMTDIEIGYRFGSQVSFVGSEGGALLGFAGHSGLGLMMAADQDNYKKYLSVQKEKEEVSAEEEVEIFGCELYQISTLILQQLGFGTEFAMGVALASGRVDESGLDLSKQTYHWEAAHAWIRALREQRNYPREAKHREMFREVKPPPAGSGERNRRLEVLYTDIGRLNRSESEWKWHLPKPDYGETREHYGLG